MLIALEQQGLYLCISNYMITLVHVGTLFYFLETAAYDAPRIEFLPPQRPVLFRTHPYMTIAPFTEIPDY